MTQNKIANLITLLLITFTTVSLQTDNFVLDAFLTQTDLVNTERQIRMVLRQYFNYDPIKTDFSQLLDEILFTTLHQCKTTMKEGGSEHKAIGLTKNDLKKMIARQDNYYTSSFNITDDEVTLTEFRRIIYNYFVYRFQLVASDPKNVDVSKINEINLDDALFKEIVDLVGEEYKMTPNFEANCANRTKELIEIKNKELAKALPLYNQLAKLRFESHQGIDNFLERWLESIIKKETRVDENTHPKIVVILKAYPIIYNGNGSTLTYVNLFARNVLIKDRKTLSKIDEQDFIKKIWISIFNMYAENNSYDSIIEGVKLWVDYFFEHDTERFENIKRGKFLEQLFSLEGFKIDFANQNENSRERLNIYIMDALRIISRNSEFKKEGMVKSMKKIFPRFNEFLNFNPKNVFVLDRLDKLFDKDELKSDNIDYSNIGFFKRLYSVMISMSQDYKDIDRVNLETKEIIIDFDSYLDYTRLFMNQLEDFQMDIDKYYSVFKLHNLFVNRKIFKENRIPVSILAVNSEVIKESGADFIKRDAKFLKFINFWSLKKDLPAELSMSTFSNQEFDTEFLEEYFWTVENNVI